MGHELTLEVPEELYKPLSEKAKQTGVTPEELASRWLAAAIRNAVDDPVEKFIGTLRSATPDWSDQHDKYIGQSLKAQMRDNKEDEGK
jgi:hypothetical protein